MRFRNVMAIPALALTACQPEANPKGGSVDGLNQEDAALQQALDAKNLDKIVTFYADDAVLLPTAEPMVEGKAAIAKEWEHILAIPDFSSSGKRVGSQVSTSGDLGYTWGTYRAKMMGEDGNPVEEPGKWVTIWKHVENAGWRIAMETYNTDIPPPDHK